MPLAQRVIAGRETLEDLEIASWERYDEARELFTRSWWTGAAYLAGYVCELLFKAAVLRVVGCPDTADAFTHLEPVRKAWNAASASKLKTRHEAHVWADVLLSRRAHPLPRAVHTEVLAAKATLAINWHVNLRYHGWEVDASDAADVLEAAEALHRNREALWR